MKGFILIVTTLLASSFALPLSAAEQAATVTLATGRANITTPQGIIRSISKDDAINAGDTVITGPSSYINLKFTDGGRILVRPNSRFQVAEYRFTPERSGENTQRDRNVETRGGGNAIFRLLKGGFRSVTGLIGRENRENFEVRTPVATIGIRGTDFEARLCSGDCFDVDPMPQDGLYTGVFEGGIAVRNSAAVFDRDPGEYAFVPAADQSATALPKRPRVLAQDPMPDPQACD